jgi:lysine-N-methylase
MDKLLNTKLLRVPSHVQNFQCKQCGECCLQKWRIEIDQKTYDKVKEKYTELGRDEELAKMMNREESGRISMNFNKGRCTALTEETLCIFQKELGHEYLSNTCKVYPRHITVSSRGMEFALTFSCNAAAETLRNKEKIRVIEYKDDAAELQYMKPNRAMYYLPERVSPKDLKHFYFEIEQGLVAIMQDRNYTVSERLVLIGLTIGKLLAFQGKDIQVEQIRDVLQNYRETVTVAPNHQAYLKALWHVLNLRMNEEGNTVFKNTVSTFSKMIAVSDEGIDLQAATMIAKLGPGQLMLPVEQFMQKWGRYVSPGMKECEHLLENYFVNFILKKELYFLNPVLAYFKMALLYAVLNFYVTGYCTMTKKIVDETTILRSVVELDNGLNHSDAYFKKLSENLTKQPPVEVIKQAFLLARI